jgi:hypothetical protein
MLFMHVSNFMFHILYDKCLQDRYQVQYIRTLCLVQRGRTRLYGVPRKIDIKIEFAGLTLTLAITTRSSQRRSRYTKVVHRVCIVDHVRQHLPTSG